MKYILALASLFLSSFAFAKIEVSNNLNLPGNGRIWAYAELSSKHKEISLFCGARAWDEDISSNVKIIAYNDKGKKIWKSKHYKIPTVCGRFNYECRGRDDTFYEISLSTSLVKDIKSLELIFDLNES